MPYRRGVKRKRGVRGRVRSRPRFIFGRKRHQSSGKGVTTQHDSRMIYRKKGMPKGRKCRWKRFTKRVHAVSEKALGAQTVVFNKTFVLSNSTAQEQAYGSLCLYGNKSTSSAYNDLTAIRDRHKAPGATVTMQQISDVGLGSNLNHTSKFLFQSAVLDITFRNTSGDGTTLNSEMTLEVDVYECTWGTKAVDGVTALNSLDEAFDAGALITTSIGQQGGSIVPEKRGITPWEIPQALSQWRIKILKKTKYFVPNNGQFTYQTRDPARHTITADKIEDNIGCNIPGLTKWIYITAKTLPGITVSPTKQERLTMGVTRKYMYKIRGEASRRDYYVNA